MQIETRSFLLVLFTVGGFSSLHGQQETGSLIGQAWEKKTGQPSPSANVVVIGTRLGAAADTEGRYEIRSIPVGVYSVRFSMVGYEEYAVTDKESFTIFPFLPVLGVSARF